MIELTKWQRITLHRGMSGTIAVSDLTRHEKRQNTLEALHSAGLLRYTYPEQNCTDIYSLTDAGKDMVFDKFGIRLQ
jgi:hypothetical protein